VVGFTYNADMSTPWDKNWEKGALIGEGGQGCTYHATSKNGKSGFVLKTLKNQKNLERRARMFIEVSNLKILNHEFIPKLIESNTDDYRDSSKDLYFVSEFISGSTLEKYIEKQKLSLDDALIFSMIVCETIEYAHKQGVYHRDIKPDNVIVANDDAHRPFLIDFGLSFNGAIATETTPSWEQLGNRFLSLPELRVSEGNRRDARSDVTMACGLLIFVLTGIPPVDLIDEKGSKPHQRNKEKEILKKTIPPEKLALLNRIFDIGFNQGINDRWQTIESLKMELANVATAKTPKENMDAGEKLGDLKIQIQQRHDYKYLQDLIALFEKIDAAIKEVLAQVVALLKPVTFSTKQGGYGIDTKNRKYTNGLGLFNALGYLEFYPRFTAYTSGSEIVIEAEEAGSRIELLRFPLSEEIDFGSFKKKLEDYFISGVKKNSTTG